MCRALESWIDFELKPEELAMLLGCQLSDVELEDLAAFNDNSEIAV